MALNEKYAREECYGPSPYYTSESDDAMPTGVPFVSDALPSEPGDAGRPVRKKGDGIEHASLAEPSLVATAMTFMNEMAELDEFRGKLSTREEDE